MAAVTKGVAAEADGVAAGADGVAAEADGVASATPSASVATPSTPQETAIVHTPRFFCTDLLTFTAHVVGKYFLLHT